MSDNHSPTSTAQEREVTNFHSSQTGVRPAEATSGGNTYARRPVTERIARTLADCDPDGGFPGREWPAYSHTAFNVLIAMRDPTEAQIAAIDAALHDNWPNARQMAVAMHHALVDAAMSEVVAGMYGVAGEPATVEAGEGSPLDWSRERLWLSSIVQQMLNAIAEGQIDSPELAGEPEVGILPYRWHEEWAAVASAAMACADPRAPEPTPIAADLAEALTWVLPLAKGYAAGRDVAANQRIIQNAEEILAAHAKGSTAHQIEMAVSRATLNRVEIPPSEDGFLAAWTAPGNSYPPYINLAAKGGDVIVVLRGDSETADGLTREGPTASMRLPRAALLEALTALQSAPSSEIGA